MSPRFNVHEQDDKLARSINQEARSDPSSPYAGKFVAINCGKVIAIEETLEAATAALEKVTADRGEGLVVEASADYEGPHEIWAV